MRKFTFLAFSLALALSQSVLAQEKAQEITYVEDSSQGYLFNRFRDNWFITAEGGAGIDFSPNMSERDLADRWNPTVAVYGGKWFSPLLGVRVGVNWMKSKGLSELATFAGVRPDEPTVNGYYKQVFSYVGPVFDVMFNFTNWVRGYRPGRKYSLVLYGGAGGYWTYSKVYDGTTSKGWKNIHDRVPAFRCGIINSYKVSDQVQLALDIRFIGMDNHPDEESAAWNKTHYVLQGNLGVTYLFKKREWYPPVVPVCPEIPEPENCDAYIARLQAADARIADLEAQLKECQEKPAPKAEVAKPERPDPLATVYFPINVYKLSSKDEKMLRSISEVIKKNPTKKYILTGWADNYTGNDRINTNLRRNRVNSVHKALLSYGVPSSQLSTATDNATLCDLGEKYAALGRAVTIEEAQ